MTVFAHYANRAGAQVGQRLRRRPLALLALALLLSTLGVSLTLKPKAAAADTQPCTVSVILVNSCRPWLGATAANYPQVPSDSLSQLSYHEQRIGRQLDIVHTYHNVGDNALTPTDVSFATRANTMLFTNWKPTAKWADLTGQNAAIDQMAASIKAISPNRMFLTLNHEPENDVSPGGDSNCPNVTYKGTAGSVADYRAMWRHVRTRFAADGVNNVVWVMDYMNWPPWDCLIPDLYPGNDLVDWVTFNGYQLAGNATFTSIVSHMYNILTTKNDATHDFMSKPWGVLEWGEHGYTPQQEINYINSAKAALDANTFPRLKAYMAYDENDKASPTGKNHRVAYNDDGTSNPTKASSYYAFAADPRFVGSYRLPPPPGDNSPLTVTLTSPLNGDSVSNTVNVTGTVADPAKAAGVSLLVDGTTWASGMAAFDGGISLPLDTTRLPNGVHALQLQAVNASGTPFSSSTVSATVNNISDTTAPTVPTNLSLTPGVRSIGLSWTASTDNVGVKGYYVNRNGIRVATVTAGTSYTDTSLTTGTRYYYAVVAFDAAGNKSAKTPAQSAVAR